METRSKIREANLYIEKQTEIFLKNYQQKIKEVFGQEIADNILSRKNFNNIKNQILNMLSASYSETPLIPQDLLMNF